LGFCFHGCRDWEISAAYTGVKVKVPSKFIIGDQDWCLEMFNKDYILGQDFKNDVPLLEDVVVIQGAAHFINQEKPDEINKHIIEFLRKY
jgi:pimeloyl-ACP methyl ester carboxylesterase